MKGLRSVENHPTPVIPAKAGIQSDDRTFPKVCGVDSRFRGNDEVGFSLSRVSKGGFPLSRE
jgi:hypothetical protein